MKSNQKDKRILKAAIAVALLIVVGGTFAWFTSKDEVTNRLTASQNYGVSITETFEPDDNWIPGQDINKDVSVVNTGDIDAFVKVSLANSLNLTIRDVTETAPDDESASAEYVTLSDDEVKALQAGAQLVSKENDALQVYQRSISDNKAEYVGYYVTGTGDSTKYYAVELTKNADGNGNDKFTAQYVIKKAGTSVEPTLNYDALASGDVITATYAGKDETANTADDIIINIKLVEGWSDNWTYNSGDNAFYYNKILASGKTSEKLIDALELDSSVTEEAYSEFTYDLTVNLNSIQATADAIVTIDNKEHYAGTKAVNNETSWKMEATVKESSLDVEWKAKSN